MKGIIETIPEFFQIIAGITVALILIFLAFQLTSVFRNSPEATLSGDKQKISSTLVKYIEACWDQNRNGLSPTSAVCKSVNLNSKVNVTEFDVTKLLNCELIPNNQCLPYNCSSCVSKRYSDQDKIEWNISDERNFTISYDGYERFILVS